MSARWVGRTLLVRSAILGSIPAVSRCRFAAVDSALNPPLPEDATDDGGSSATDHGRFVTRFIHKKRQPQVRLLPPICREATSDPTLAHGMERSSDLGTLEAILLRILSGCRPPDSSSPPEGEG